MLPRPAAGRKPSLSHFAFLSFLTQALACGAEENGVPRDEATGGASSGAAGIGGTSVTGGSGGTSVTGGSGGTNLAGSSAGPTGGTMSSTGGSATGGAGGSVGGSSSGGTNDTGGAGGVSGTGTGGKAGSTGAMGGTGGKGGGAGSGASAGSSGSGSGNREVFSNCRFHFGTIDSKATGGGASLISQLDFFTPGWMLSESFDQRYVCDATRAGGPLEGKVPIVVAYLAAGIVKRRHNICDCNVTTCGSGNDLCRQGAALIKQDKQTILNAYRSFSQGYAGCYGTTKPIVFEMEPDIYQYTGSSQTAPWTPAEAGQIMAEFVAALKSSLPNARFSLDVSPWVAPNNGSDHGADWFRNFDMSLFTFVNTSGGGTNANTAKIRSSNNMTWAGLRQASGKPILADTGYGANGVSAGEDPNWNVAANVNARIADGVISISQYNPGSSWANTISSLRPQLNATSSCP
ncbi:MAG TPA: hypothetical protein VFZ53_00015 [Polyangiaceae bacterium]